MVKSLFRPSDDATVFPFFIPGNAMLSVELNHLSQLLSNASAAPAGRGNSKLHQLAADSSRLSKEIRDAIYKYGIVDHPTHGRVFACKFFFCCCCIDIFF